MDLLQEIDQNGATAGLVLPHGLDKDPQQGRETTIQLLLDGQDGNTGIIALGYLTAILQDYMRDRFATAAGAADLYEQGIALAVFGGVIFIFLAQSFQKRMK